MCVVIMVLSVDEQVHNEFLITLYMEVHQRSNGAVKTVHCVGGVEQRMKPQPIFSVSVKPWLHSHIVSGLLVLGARGY
jgi:hypothetical protein